MHSGLYSHSRSTQWNSTSCRHSCFSQAASPPPPPPPLLRCLAACKRTRFGRGVSILNCLTRTGATSVNLSQNWPQKNGSASLTFARATSALLTGTRRRTRRLTPSVLAPSSHNPATAAEGGARAGRARGRLVTPSAALAGPGPPSQSAVSTSPVPSREPCGSALALVWACACAQHPDTQRREQAAVFVGDETPQPERNRGRRTETTTRLLLQVCGSQRRPVTRLGLAGSRRHLGLYTCSRRPPQIVKHTACSRSTHTATDAADAPLLSVASSVPQNPWPEQWSP
jgi:hypothetical protein